MTTQRIKKLLEVLEESIEKNWTEVGIIRGELKGILYQMKEEVERLEKYLESLGHDTDCELLNPTAFHMNKDKEQLNSNIKLIEDNLK